MDIKDHLAFLASSPKALQRLNATTPPAWGKMTAQHMVEHLSSAIVMSLKNTIYNAPPDLETVLRNKAHTLSNGLRRGTVLDDGNLKKLRAPDLNSAIADYANHLDNFLSTIKTTVLETCHIYFGQLNNDEWIAFHYWHIQHHLNQFGLL